MRSDRRSVHIAELCDPKRTLHIDSKVLNEAEAASEPIARVDANDSEDGIGNGDSPRRLTKKQQAELLRSQVDTVGRPGKPGEQIQNIISVSMLSEGWGRKDGYAHHGSAAVQQSASL